MSELSEQEKQLLAQMEAEEQKAMEAISSKPESDRAKPLPKEKTDFPIGIIPDAEDASS